MFKKIALASVGIAVLNLGQSASAGQTTSTMNVQATVNKTCVVTTAPVDYSGTYDPVSANSATPAGDITFSPFIAFKCTKASTGVTVGITQGNNYSSGRRLKDGTTNFLNYD